jgi:hypothetical protein
MNAVINSRVGVISKEELRCSAMGYLSVRQPTWVGIAHQDAKGKLRKESLFQRYLFLRQRLHFQRYFILRHHAFSTTLQLAKNQLTTDVICENLCRFEF